ncbi:MAG: glycosyltransferase, partial [Parcubacteria group bacterium]|nr:glycosyltransferase [Parcubacteria group bacterium]
FARFIRRVPDAHLMIVGEGPSEAGLRAHARALGLTEAVTFFGHQEHVARFYRMADAFIATSRIEGFSNSLLEALAAGLPVVATKTAGTDEALAEGVNGFFAEPTPEGVASALEKLAGADRGQLGRAARATASRYDIASTVAQYQDLFNEAYGATA